MKFLTEVGIEIGVDIESASRAANKEMSCLTEADFLA